MTEDIFEKAIALPSTVWGYFEWLTGTVRLNVDTDAFENGAILGQQKLGLDETYYHEIFHCCQICTTGFLYYHVAHFLKGIAPVWRRLTESGLVDNSTVPEIVGNVIKDVPELPKSISELFAQIDSKSITSGLTPRDIIEGQAYFIQKLSSDATLTNDQFLKLLSAAPSRLYAKAYLAAHRILGEKTFLVFNGLVFESLCYLDPQNVFLTICESIEDALKKGIPIMEAIKCNSSEIGKTHLFLGDSLEVAKTYITNQQHNPFYSTNISFLQKIGQEKKMNFLGLMANPQHWFPSAAKKMDLLIILNPSTVYEHTALEEWIVFDKVFNAKLRLILAAICLIICNGKSNNSPKYLHLKNSSALGNN